MNIIINTETGEDIGSFDLPAVPRPGDIIYVSFRKMLVQEAAHPGTFNEDVVSSARRWNSSKLQVVAVHWEAQYGLDGRVEVIVREAP